MPKNRNSFAQANGYCAFMGESFSKDLLEIVQRDNLKIVEDNAQARCLLGKN
jgi:hypothetical protein